MISVWWSFSATQHGGFTVYSLQGHSYQDCDDQAGNAYDYGDAYGYTDDDSKSSVDVSNGKELRHLDSVAWPMV